MGSGLPLFSASARSCVCEREIGESVREGEGDGGRERDRKGGGESDREKEREREECLPPRRCLRLLVSFWTLNLLLLLYYSRPRVE